MTISPPDAYTPLTHLEAECRVLRAHCRYLALRDGGHRFLDAEDVLARRDRAWRLRQDVDARVKVTVGAGIDLPLVTLHREMDLSSVEVTALVAAASVAVGADTEVTSLGRGLALVGVSMDVLATVCELSLCERLKLLTILGPEGRLTSEGGLLCVEPYDDYEQAWLSGISLTTLGLNILTGKQEVGDE